LALRMGAVECFSKPVDLRTLAECIRQRAGKPPEAADSTGEAAVTGILREAGIPAHLKGYLYLGDAILIALREGNVCKGGWRGLYQAVAVKYGTTAPRVDRDIHCAIRWAWERGGALPGGAAGRAPANSRFIAAVVEKLRLRERRGPP